MEPETQAAAASAPAAENLSLIARAIAIFTRPAHAWAGLETRARWWFPMLLILVFVVI